VNSVDAQGGSLNYSGAVVAGGMVYVMSGYSFSAGMPGKVLLAFQKMERKGRLTAGESRNRKSADHWPQTLLSLVAHDDRRLAKLLREMSS
jgi:hypothetical protein